MKKLISIILIAVALLASGTALEAKTKKSKSGKSSSSITVQKDRDGDPILVGHTYSYKGGGIRLDLKFLDYGYVDMIATEHGYTQSFTVPWDYDGETVDIYDPAVPQTPMLSGTVSRDGQTIRLITGYTLKIIK